MPVSPHEMELLSRQINQAHHSAIRNGLARAGLAEVGHPMLMSVLQMTCDQGEDGLCHAQRELAEQLRVSPAAVANSLKSLEKGDYIRREPGKQDARRNRVILTEKGRSAVKNCQTVFEEVSRQMLEGFSEEEKELLLSFRQRMLNNLRGQDPEKLQETFQIQGSNPGLPHWRQML